ncbi:MAG: hypothetical protein ACD_9C00073G0007 [uncultured bacterium]|nr:MAG: hypothetical protein ACD_9C00073G0007 [uncultured bacterium]
MNKKKFSFVIIFFIAGIVLAVFILSNAVREAYRSRSIEKEVENLKKEAERIQSENKELAERIAYLETPEFQEKIAKEKLNLQKADENVVVVKQGAAKENQPSNEQITVQEDLREIPNYRKWWDFFFKYN